MDEERSARCAVCGWPLAETQDKGCLPGDCGMRPLPKRYYDPERAAKEAKKWKGMQDALFPHPEDAA